MVESASAAQQIAIRASFRGYPMGPMQWTWWNAMPRVPQGDVEEVRALKAVFNSSKRTVITSFKSQIGHTLAPRH